MIRSLVTKALGVDPLAWLVMSIGNASVTVIRPRGSPGAGTVGHLRLRFGEGPAYARLRAFIRGPNAAISVATTSQQTAMYTNTLR